MTKKKTDKEIPSKKVRQLVARLLSLCDQLALTKRELDRACNPKRSPRRKLNAEPKAEGGV